MNNNSDGDGTSMPAKITPEIVHVTLAKLQEAVFKRRPILGEIIEKHKDQTIYEYARDFLDINSSPVLDNRKSELIDTAKDLLTVRLGKDIANKVVEQLKKHALVSTSDHHAPVAHPFFLNTNIISLTPSFGDGKFSNQFQVVFSFASVSLNNASGYARGLLFHGGEYGEGANIRLPFFADKYKMGVVYGMKKFTLEDLQKAKEELNRKVHLREISMERAQKIIEIIDGYFADEEVLNAEDLSTQITVVNYKLWPHLFHNGKGEHEDKMPYLIYLDIETLVKEVLVRYHLKDSQSFLNQILFDKNNLEKFSKAFDGLSGCYTISARKGTFLFWGLDKINRRIPLFLTENNYLCSNDNEFCIPFTPEGISSALKEKKIFPAMITCYLLVSLYYGMKCLGGFCQVHELTSIKNSWMQLLNDLNLKEESEAVIPVQTKEFDGDGIVLAYLKNEKGIFAPATGIDLMIANQNNSFSNFVKLAGGLKMGEVMRTLLTEMYEVLYPINEREIEYAFLTPEVVWEATGIGKKINEIMA